jgi:2-hydroxychromene-2-carboxylate isomerase
MNKTIDFYFDVGSPASYLAWTQLPALAEAAGAQLNYCPMLLGAVFQATVNSSPVLIPAKGRWMLADFARFSRRYGVAFRFPPNFPLNTLQLMRAAVAVQLHAPERFNAYLEAIFSALWADGLDLAEPVNVAKVLAAAGFDPAQLLALAQQPEVKERLRETTETAVARGVFGAPSMFVGDELFFGQDRLDFVKQALES